jgi:acyl-coenzyme A synthetase/AMP-(fatty) acid ligase
MAGTSAMGPDVLRHWIARAAARDPDKFCILSAEDGRTITYGELQRLTGRIATFLRDRDFKANDRVALLANNSIEHLACYFGVMAYGATICTIHVEMNRAHLDHILPTLRPRLVLTEDGLGLEDLPRKAAAPHLPLGAWDRNQDGTFFAEVAACAPSEASTDADERCDAVILFTSGTSARPKGVVLNFREHLSNIDPTADGFGIGPDDRIYDFRSYNWASAQLLSALVPVCRGASVVMARKFSASRFFPHIRDFGATVAAGNPTVLNMLLNGEETAHRDNLPTLRFITSSSAPLLPEEWRRFEQRFGIRVAQGYGCSETGWMAAISGEGRRIGTVGRPFPNHALAIVDAEGRRLAPGEIGAVEVGGLGDHEYRYLADDGTIEVNARGRIRTGDIGFLDQEGYLHLTGREKEIIIRGGVNISPVEIDSLLMQRPELIEAATVGVPHAIYGEEVVSYVVARADTSVDVAELLRYCNAALPAFKAPKEIVLSASLPKTERGKLDRKALVGQWSRERGG